MNIQVLGAGGMLGEAVCTAVLAAGHSLVASTTVDITRIVPADIRADTVINCAGLVKQREVSNARMLLVNGYGPQRIADACQVWNARLVQVSTDCVFQGPGPHAESDHTDATDGYAYSKRAGEITQKPHLTVRTSFVGFGLRGLVHDLGTQPEIRASARLLWSGHWVSTIAETLVTLAVDREVTGLLHLPGASQTRFDLAATLCTHFRLPCRVIRDDSFVADRRLRSTRWNALGLAALPPFVDQLPKSEVLA